MIITSIENQKKIKKRYSIFIDGEFSFGISEIDLLYYKLEIGKEITKKKYDEIIENLILNQCKEKAFNLISFKNRTIMEMKKRLKEYEYNDEVIERVIEILIKYNYLDDYKYTEKYISDKLEIKGYGKYRIKNELRQKFVSNEIIEELLIDTEVIESEKIISLIEKKMRNKRFKDITTKEKYRIFNFLQRRGYSYSIIKEGFAKVEKKEGE